MGTDSKMPEFYVNEIVLLPVMKNKSLRFRQIHLDFHTSPDIEGIGSKFDKKEWQETLQRARVDSITCFSKCHHGLSYHPTKIGAMHPHLSFDLLRAQMDACKEIDVKVPVYLSAGVDNTITQTHSDWREIDANGKLAGWSTSLLHAGFHKLCFNTPYLDYLSDQIREACQLFPEADGIFLDIIAQGPCCCTACIKSMAAGGLDASQEADRLRHADVVLDRYFQKTTAAAQEANPDMPVVHNSGHLIRGRRDQVAYQTHLELESLPTGGWGYDHFPESASYASHVDRDFLGMTGKFHNTWGEFGGFKHPNALRYECAAMLAFGAKCSVGDQLHPEGRLDRSTYELVGAPYAEVEAKQPWCVEALPVADIAVLSSEAENGRKPEHSRIDTGTCRILLEGHHLFTLIDRETDFSGYKLLILPDDIAIEAELEEKVGAYLKQGGKLLLTGRSGLRKEGNGFVFDIGAEHQGSSPFAPDYLLPAPEFRSPFVNTPLVMYTRSERIRATTGQSLGEIYDPYFNRDFRHFCSHQHTPNRPEPSGFDCGVRHGNIVYLTHPVFTLYFGYGAVAYKDYVLAAINSLLGNSRTLRAKLPSSARVTLTRQPAQNRRIVHLLYANKISRGAPMTLDSSIRDSFTLEVIEDLDPLHGSIVEVRDSDKVARITLEPQGREISFQRKKDAIEFTIEKFACHQMVVLHES
jgi:Hypothetical glycosyl hydrolase 6/Beta-galactosidase trimerisation domain